MWRTARGDQPRGDDGRGDTGSVGESTAPSRKASAQLSSGRAPSRRAPVSAIVIGIAITSARATGLQWRPQQLALDEHPVGEEGEDQGQLDQLDDRLVAASTLTTPVAARPIAERDREHRGGETVPLITPESAATTASSPPKKQQRLAEADVHRAG